MLSINYKCVFFGNSHASIEVTSCNVIVLSCIASLHWHKGAFKRGCGLIRAGDHPDRLTSFNAWLQESSTVVKLIWPQLSFDMQCNAFRVWHTIQVPLLLHLSSCGPFLGSSSGQRLAAFHNVRGLIR